MGARRRRIVLEVTPTEHEQFTALAARCGMRPAALARGLLHGFHADTLRLDAEALMAAARAGGGAPALLN